MLKERFSIGECRVEDIDIESVVTQVRAQVQDAERCVALHDLKLLGVFVEEVAVGEEEFCHLDMPSCCGQCVEGNQVLGARLVRNAAGKSCGFRVSHLRFKLKDLLPEKVCVYGF